MFEKNERFSKNINCVLDSKTKVFFNYIKYLTYYWGVSSVFFCNTNFMFCLISVSYFLNSGIEIDP